MLSERVEYKSTLVAGIIINHLSEKIPVSSLSLLLSQSIYYALFGKPKKDLYGELAMVTGGGGGLGRLLAMRLTKLGAKVIVWDINQDGEYHLQKRPRR